MKVIVICLLLTFAMCEIGNTNNEDASTPEDVAAFRSIHEGDDAVLFFHDSSDSKSVGFFESIFGLFGGNGDLDEEYQSLLAEKYPTLEIDTKIEALKKTKDNYQVTDLPYIIAYHKGKEIWREMPSKKSPLIIEGLINDQESAKLQFYPEGHTSINQQKKDVVKDINLNTPQVIPRRIVPAPIQIPVQVPRVVTDNGYSDPFDPTQHYRINDDPRYINQDYGQSYWNGRYAGPGERVMYSDPSIRRIPDEYIPSDSFSTRRAVRDGLQGGSYVNAGVSNRNIVRSVPSSSNTASSTTITSSGARNQAIESGTIRSDNRPQEYSYGPAEVQQGVTIRKYDADSHSYSP